MPYRAQRASPYLYSDAEIGQLLQAATQLPSPTGLRAQTYVTAFGLLAVTGMRVGELVGLDDQDVDIRRGQLTIRHGKFGKSRLLPLHPSTREALGYYVAERERRYPIPQTPSFLVSEQGIRLTNWTLRRTFVTLSRQIGLGSMIFATDSPSRCCCAGTGRTSMSNVTSRSSRPTSDM